MDIDRKHVLIACAIAGPVLGVVLAVLQAVAPHAAGARAHRRDRADACGEDPAYRRAALRPPPRQRPAKPGAAARGLTEVKLLIAYCKRKGGLVLAGKSDPAFNRERLQLVFNETAADLRTLGIDCAALVDVKRVLPASTVSVLYDCLYDFAAAAFAASNPILMLFVSDKAEAGEGEGSDDGVAAGRQHRRVVEMRAALEAEESAQTEGYTRSLEELRRILERRNVRFALDIAPDGATLAVQVSEGEGVA
ncbi:hypothetical protein [Senegalimassilia anaerobia]